MRTLCILELCKVVNMRLGTLARLTLLGVPVNIWAILMVMPFMLTMVILCVFVSRLANVLGVTLGRLAH